MKCQICESFFLQKCNFSSLYHIEELCEQCKNKYQPRVQYEMFPIEGGVIHYYYLYSELDLNVKQRIYLKRYWRLLYDLIKKTNLDRFPIIFLDDNPRKSPKPNLSILSGFKQIVFVSLLRYNFEEFMIFF